MRRFLAIILFFIFLTTFVFADTSPINEIYFLKYGFYPEKARIVFDCKDAPDYNIYLSENQKEIIIDFFNSKISAEFKPEELKYDFMLSDIDYNVINFRQIQFKIKLKYKITQANIEKLVLKDPHRLSVDIFREYTLTNEFKVTKNIILTQKLIIGQKDKLLINELLIDKNSKDVSFKVKLANNDIKSKEKLSLLAQKEGALAAINGGYFAKEGGPLGLIIIDGKIMYENIKKRPPRTCFGMTADKKFIFDRVYAQDDKISTKDGTNWDNVVYAIGAGPRLIKNGEIYVNAEDEELAKNGNNITKKAGRSALAVTSEDKLLLMTVSGYTGNEGQGICLDPLAGRLQKLGALDAMNLDGGGSTAMYLQNDIISMPPEAKNNFERKIADGFLVFDASPNLTPYTIRLEVKPAEIIADGVSEIGVNAFVYTQDNNPVPDGTPVFFETEGGNISLSAKTINGAAFAYLKAGRNIGYSKIIARSGIIEKSINVLFKPDKPVFLFTNIIKNNCENKKYRLEVLVTDKYYNPIENKNISFKIENGGNAAATTDKSGVAIIDIDTKEKTKVVISSDGLQTIEIEI